MLGRLTTLVVERLREDSSRRPPVYVDHGGWAHLQHASRVPPSRPPRRRHARCAVSCCPAACRMLQRGGGSRGHEGAKGTPGTMRAVAKAV